MKSKSLILAGLVIAFSAAQLAKADFSRTTYQSRDYQEHLKCTFQFCRETPGGGEEFLKYCAEARKNYMPGQIGFAVMVWSQEGTPSCYCPCDLEFENQVRTGQEY